MRPAPGHTPRLDLAELITLVRAVAPDDTAWRPLVRFDRTTRWWTRLHADDAVDVWLLTWLRDQATDLHDHGGSAAAFTVVSGAVEEVRAGPTGDLTRWNRRRGETRWVAPTVVHDVRNVAVEPAVTIHAYTPPLARMTYYRRTRRRLAAARTVRISEPEAVTSS